MVLLRKQNKMLPNSYCRNLNLSLTFSFQISYPGPSADSVYNIFLAVRWHFPRHSQHFATYIDWLNIFLAWLNTCVSFEHCLNICWQLYSPIYIQPSWLWLQQPSCLHPFKGIFPIVWCRILDWASNTPVATIGSRASYAQLTMSRNVHKSYLWTSCIVCRIECSFH